MKKIIIVLFCVTVVYAITNQKEEILIPDDSIRFRVIANSDEEQDQSIKMKIKDDVEEEIDQLMVNAKNINEARSLISTNLSKIQSIVDKYNIPYQLNFGMNYFPEKEFKGITYQEGTYESLVITLGSGKGQNWWCVMFPPLCLLEAEENSLNNIDYKFYVKTILDKYL